MVELQEPTSGPMLEKYLNLGINLQRIINSAGYKITQWSVILEVYFKINTTGGN